MKKENLFTIGFKIISKHNKKRRRYIKRKMSKLMQKLVFFIEPTDKGYELSSTVGNLCMNRFAIDEDAGHEIVNIHEATFKTHRKLPLFRDLPLFLPNEEKKQQGTDQIIFTVNSYDGIV